MQYPIIDLITSAYINNGWTGLELSEGKNIFPINEWFRSWPAPPNSIIGNDTYYVEAGTYTLSFDYYRDGADSITSFWRMYRNNVQQVNTSLQYQFGNLGLQLSASTWTHVSLTFTINESGYFGIDDGQLRGGVHYRNIMLEQGNTETPYEPYTPPTTDFPNRLKLPLPHYFPHPVIDALQRAAAGTQTADDTEILRHYLTPLGIGGI